MKDAITYKDAGVDISKGEKAVSDIKQAIKSTYSKNVIGGIGGFGGLFEIPAGYRKPVLVSSTDGVGTKLRVAIMAGKHDTVGEDLVNHCINDIAVLGAMPLYFLDYFATAKLDNHVFNQVVSGFVRGCKNNHVALLGGETAEMPGIYHNDDYDVCGTIVGIIEKDAIIDGSKIAKGDLLIGIESNGLHTNGFSLARKVLLDNFKHDQYVAELQSTIAEELLRVHTCYLPIIQSLIQSKALHGIAHITGGGLAGNTSRLLKDGLKPKINWDCWDSLPIFNLIQQTGNVPDNDMRRTFNLGIGLVLIVNSSDSDFILDRIAEFNKQAWIIGEIV